MKERNRTWYQLSIVVTLVFILFFSSIFLVEKTGQHLLGAVTYGSGTNATLTLYDDGDSIKNATTIIPDIEVNNLFNDTSNVYFYANYTNATGQSMVSVSGTVCAIEFEAGAGGNNGPFAMIANTTLNVWEYNRSFANNGTFIWNTTCSNADAGTATVRVYDSVRIFSNVCYSLENILPNQITNNTIMCGGVESAAPASSKSVFTINNNNITLDCNFTIFRGLNVEVGIDIGQYNGTIIKNCIFENYTTAINNSFVGLDAVLLFNNSFANLSGNALKLGTINNLTLRSNNFTNSTGSAIIIENVTNATITQNYFCNNGVPTIYNLSANYSAANNTFCVNLIAPANNTNHLDINFTFSVPSFGYTRTCNLMLNSVNASGKTTVSEADETARNITLNASLYLNIDNFNWKINCTDDKDNKGLSVIYDATYRACTVPTAGMSIPTKNITFCPGIYYLNTTEDAITQNTRASGIICNNTIMYGNGSGSAVDVGILSSDGQVKHCVFNNFYNGIMINNYGSHRFKIINNTFQNFSNDGISPIRTNNTNITNNSFINLNKAIWLVDSYNNTIAHNYFYNLSTGVHLENATNTTINNNNFTNLTAVALRFGPNTPLVNMTAFNYTVSNNYFCGISTTAILTTDYSVTTSLNGITNAGVNTFCNSTSSMPNGAIARVGWSIHGFVYNNIGSINSSTVAARTRQDATEDIETSNATGGTSMILEEFNITTDNVVLYKTPHTFIATASGSTKTLSVAVNRTMTNSLGNAVGFNLSDPDPLPNIRGHAKAAAIRAARASAQASAQAAEVQEDDKDEEEEKKVIVESINYTYALLLKEIIFDNEVVYSQTTEAVPLVFKDYESYTLMFIVENNGTGNISNFIYSLRVPESINIISSSIDGNILQAGEPAKIIFKVESADILEAFDIQFHISAIPNLSLQATLRTILEQGKGVLYSTRQKIIEETRAIITKTYEILFLLFLIPLLLLLRATTIADERALRQMIEDKKVHDYWKVYVPEETYMKYNVFQNLHPIELEDADVAKANHLAAEKKISYQLATAIIFAQQCLIPRIFTFEELSPELRHKYPRVHFVSPVRNYREDQLKRYIEKQQEKGFTNNEVRETLLAAQWSKEIIKKYLPPTNDLNMYVKQQQKKARTLGEIRKELLDVKWNKAIVDKVIPREEVMKEYITIQRQVGKTNVEIKAQLLKAGWEKEIVEKHLSAGNDLKAYITLQQHRGFTNQQIETELLSRGWKKEIVDKYLKSQ